MYAGTAVLLQDLRVIFAIGQIAGIQELPFDLGMEGVPLRLAGSLAPEATWHFVVDLGISRTEGPYIGIADPGGNVRNDAELTLEASVGLGSAAGECSPLPPAELGVGQTYSTDRCLSGQIAFLGRERERLGRRPDRSDRRRRPRPREWRRRYARFLERRGRQPSSRASRSTPTSTCSSGPAPSALRPPASPASLGRSLSTGRSTAAPNPNRWRSRSTTSTSMSAR